MTLKWLPLLIAPALLAIACGGDDSSPTASPMPSPTPEPTVQRIAYIGTDGGVWIINADGSEKRKLFDIPSKPNPFRKIQWAPDGDKFAVADGVEDIVYIVSADGRKSLEVPAVSFLTWSPTGDMFAVARFSPTDERTVLVLDSQGDTVIDLLGALGASFSADGARLSFLRIGGPGGLFPDVRGMLADLDSGQVSPIDPDEESSSYNAIGQLIFSPNDPSRLAYSQRLLDLKSGQERPLAGGASRWSPDGQLLLLSCVRGFGGEVYEVETGATVLRFDLNLLGGDQPCSGWIAARSAWSADSRLLAVREAPPEPYDEPGVIHIWDIASGEDTAISTNAAPLQFSADSAHLLLSDWETIWLVDADGANLTLLAKGSQPAWQPQR